MGLWGDALSLSKCFRGFRGLWFRFMSLPKRVQLGLGTVDDGKFFAHFVYSLRALLEIFFASLKEGGSRKARKGVAKFAKGVLGRCTELVEAMH